MPDQYLKTKIELLEDQLENLERSGHFTEMEIDKYSKYFLAEIELLKNARENSSVEASAAFKNVKELYGMTPNEFIEGRKKHNECFDQFSRKNILEMEVINPELQNQQAS